jgi:hypothetical protein
VEPTIVNKSHDIANMSGIDPSAEHCKFWVECDTYEPNRHHCTDFKQLCFKYQQKLKDEVAKNV